MRIARRAISLVLPFVILAARERAACAWGTVEHQEIGSASYAAACAEVTARVDRAGEIDPRIRARLGLACGSTGAVVATLYGDATAIAGDYVGHPSELLSATGAWRFSSRKHYLLLALENSAHFNPTATETWRAYHQDALDRALAAAAMDGLPQVEAWGQALRENAFADHMLQDAFAAGHMGFNRRASSAAAAKRFHDYWNERGRVISDRTGASWTTYGDGRLDDPANAGGRRHVLDAATRSVRDLLVTFVFGSRYPEEGLAAWRCLPFTINAPELRVDAGGLFEGRTSRDTTQTPLAATVLPARKNTVVNATLWSASPFSAYDATVAVTGNIALAIPIVPAQTVLGAGGTLRAPGTNQAPVVELGMEAPLALGVDGLLSHGVAVAASLLLRTDILTVVHAEYQGNIELGTSLISVHLGLAEFLPGWKTGWYAAIGYGLALTAAGGGSF